MTRPRKKSHGRERGEGRGENGNQTYVYHHGTDALTTGTTRRFGIQAHRCGAACLLVGCLTSQQQVSVSQGRICRDNFACCHTDIEVAYQTISLTQSKYTDTGLTSPSADPIMPLECQFLSHWYDSTRKNPVARGIRTPDLPLPRRTP